MSADDHKICPACNARYSPHETFCPRDRSPLVLPDPLVGTLLDGVYLVERRLGAGGMGEVYLARQTLTDKRVAVKVLPRQMGTSPDRVRRFLTEGRAACRLDHPNVATVYDMRSSSNGLLYMVLEYVDGESLSAVARRRGRFPLAETVEILAPVAEVLDLAHANGVVHRDVKPDNVMLGHDWKGRAVVKVLDLGIAKLLDEDAGLTQGAMIGTPPYMAPEQWGVTTNDSPVTIDGRADVYALGVTAYQMLTGAYPFPGPSTPDFQRQHIGMPPPAAHDVDPSVPEAAGRAIMRALAKDRSLRQPTASTFLAELRQATGDLSRGAVPPIDRRVPRATAPRISVDTSDQTVIETRTDAIQTKVRAEPRPTASGKLVGATAAVLLLAGGTVVTYVLAFRDTATSPASPTVVAPATREAFSFGIQREEADTGRTRWANAEGIERPMAPGTTYRFVLTAPDDGYFYVIASGDQMRLKAVLTNAPHPQTGLTSNRVAAGLPFEFPGAGRSIRLNGDELKTPFKLIFSPTRLESPTFFASTAPDLDVGAQRALDDFLSSAVRGVREASGALPVRIAVPTDQDRTRPVVFEFDITADVP